MSLVVAAVLLTTAGCAFNSAEQDHRLSVRLAADDCRAYDLLAPSAFASRPGADVLQAQIEQERDSALAGTAETPRSPPWVRSTRRAGDDGVVVTSAWKQDGRWMVQTTSAQINWSRQDGVRRLTTGERRTNPPQPMPAFSSRLVDQELAKSCLMREPLFVGDMQLKGSKLFIKNYDSDPSLLLEVHIDAGDRTAYQSAPIGVTGAIAGLLVGLGGPIVKVTYSGG